MWAWTGLLTAMVNGPGRTITAGRGSITRPGAGLLIITGVGSATVTTVGVGGRVNEVWPTCGVQPWSDSSAPAEDSVGWRLLRTRVIKRGGEAEVGLAATGMG